MHFNGVSISWLTLLVSKDIRLFFCSALARAFDSVMSVKVATL
jgi:hypothetical protein